MRYLSLLALLLTCLAQPLHAEPATPAPPPPEVGEDPGATGSAFQAESADRETQGPVAEPEVTIIRRRDAVFEEYRRGGKLYMVKVLPRFAPPYYFVDADGDGMLETTPYPWQPGMVPQWILFRW